MSYFNRGYSRFAYIFLVLFVLSVIGGVGYSSHQERLAQLAFQLQRAQGSAQVVEDQITQTFQLIENMVLTLPELSDTNLAQSSPADLTRLLNRLQFGQPALRSLSVLTAKDGIKASTNAANVGLVLTLDEFIPPDANASASSVLRIGNMWEGRDFADGRSTADGAPTADNARNFLPLLFRLGVGPDAVWVLAAINTDYLLNRMQRYTHAESDQFELIRFDGHMLMQSDDEGVFTSRFDWADLLPDMQNQEIGTHTGSWLTAYRASSRYPFFFAIHVNRDAVLTQWAANFWIMVYWTGAALLAVLAVTTVLLRHVRLSEEAERLQQVELTISRDKAEAATRAKSHFLANMSHEIRTPMNGVIGMTQLALEENLPPLAERYVKSAHTAAVSLLGILNDILDFSKIEADKLEIESVPVKLPHLLNDLVTMQRFMAEDKKLTLELTLDPAVPVWIESDPLRLSQILNNLLGNAIKFTAKGRVDLRVSVGGNGLLHFEIQDQGVGMSPDQMSHLFLPFSQADSSTTRIFGGTGLGLAICKQLSDRMGGHISVVSTLGAGSTFSVDLPFVAVDAPKAASDQRRFDLNEADFAGTRLLLVEDHVLNRQLLLALLKKVNVEVHIAANGEEVLDMLTQSEQPFDLILMDIQMPVMDGITATRHIRSDNRYDDLPIVAVTANAMSDERTMCLSAGMQDYLLKPLNREALFACLARWIRV